jgi:hypothetical protein
MTEENKLTIRSLLKSFDDLDAYSQMLLAIAGGSAIAAVFGILKEFKIFDATPYAQEMLVPAIRIMEAFIIISVIVIILTLVWVAFFKHTPSPEKKTNEKGNTK